VAIKCDLVYWTLKYYLGQRFNMNMFEFVTMIFKNHMFKIGLSRIHQNINKGHNLQNRLQVDEILNISYFQVNGALKCSCKFPTFS
jgi:hypothetical protein